MGNTKLLSGFLKTSEAVGKSYLEHLEVDRLVAPCYEAIGLAPKAGRYGGWESRAIAGHSLGHFLSAAAYMYEATGDVQLKNKLIYAVDEIGFLQSQDVEGYVSGFPKDCFERVFSGVFEVDRFSLGGSWVPWYSIHKIYAGLIDAYKVTGYAAALEAVIKLADWAKRGTDRLDDEQFERMLYCEYGGMNEAMADLYELTGNEDYLKLALRFCHREVLDDLSLGIDNLEGRHANTQIPKVLGAAKVYLMTGDEKYKQTADFFWDEVIHNRSYVIGGNSRNEHFTKSGTEPLGVQTTETCNTYNMMKLSSYLFGMNPDSRYMDYYETGLFNHILASQDPDSGMKTYFMATDPGHFKTYCDPDESFWCCTGSGMENPGRYHHNIYTKIGKTLYVNLFIASEHEEADLDVILTQETYFPYEEESAITIVKSRKEPWTMAIRLPDFTKGRMQIRLNDEPIQGVVKDGYMHIVRQWASGDRILCCLPMALSVYHAKADAGSIAFKYGPIVLCAALGREDFPDQDIQPDHMVFFNHPRIQVPMLVSDDPDLTRFIKPVAGEPLHFSLEGIGQPGNVTFDLIPFFELHHQRYNLYFKWMTQADYEASALTSPSYMEQLQKITIDAVAPHEQQPEIDHQLETSASTSDYFSQAGCGYREARDGGSFSYNMKVEQGRTNYLCVTYWGSDMGGGRRKACMKGDSKYLPMG